MKFWASVHGKKACELHGMKPSDVYVTCEQDLFRRLPGTLHVVDQVDWPLAFIGARGWQTQRHGKHCEYKCVPWYKSGPNGGLPNVYQPPGVKYPYGSSERPTPHPAKFSKAVLQKIDQVCETYEIMSLLDPFAGTCKIFDVCTPFIVGIEIEREWAVQGYQNFLQRGAHPVIGNALALPFRARAFQASGTSCTYANRLADHHDAKEKCRMCGGTGLFANLTSFDKCPKCKGEGNNTYKRMTYKHQLGHDLHKDNSGQLQWGEPYRLFHFWAWREMTRVTREYFILNCSNHVRNKKEVDVCGWHVQELEKLGWMLCEQHKIETSRMKMGQNYEARVDHEMVFVFRKNV